jgi:hypothetical protein
MAVRLECLKQSLCGQVPHTQRFIVGNAKQKLAPGMKLHAPDPIIMAGLKNMTWVGWLT